jgi:hypothetical protein
MRVGCGHATADGHPQLAATAFRPLIWPVSKCNRSEKKVRPQNKAKNRPARRRIIEFKIVLRKFSSLRSSLCTEFFPIGHDLLCGFLGYPSVDFLKAPLRISISLLCTLSAYLSSLALALISWPKRGFLTRPASPWWGLFRGKSAICRCSVWLSVAPELAKSVRPTGRPHLGEHLPGLVGPLRHSFASSTTYHVLAAAGKGAAELPKMPSPYLARPLLCHPIQALGFARRPEYALDRRGWQALAPPLVI